MKPLRIFLLLLWALGAHASEKKCVRGNFKVAEKNRVEHYIYGFNGKLKDNEWAGLGNDYDYGARNYQPRIGRFISIDPLTKQFPWLTPYQFASNRPTASIDIDGLEADPLPAEEDMKDLNSGSESGSGLGAESPKPSYEDALKGAEMMIEKADAEKVERAAEANPMTPQGQRAKANEAADKAALKRIFPDIKTPEDQKNEEGVQDKDKNGPYSELKDGKSVGPGKNFTRAQKRDIINENKDRNGGVIKSDKSGRVLDPAKQSQKGVRANRNQAEVDHIIPKAKGGTNSVKNAQVLSKEENLNKSDQ